MEKSMRQSWFSAFRPTVKKLLLLALPILILDAFCAPAMAKKAKYRFIPLRELGGGASRALDIEIDTEGQKQMGIAGESRTMSGNWQGVVWRSTDHGDTWELTPLPSLGRANGRANNMIIVGNPGQSRLVVGGAVYDDADSSVPVRWEKPEDEPWMGTVLPMLGGQQGEEIGIDADFDYVTRGVGWSLDGMGVRRAVMWSPDGMGGWEIETLPSLADNAEAQANSFVDGSDFLIWLAAGYSYDDRDRMQPVAWELADGMWHAIVLPLPPVAMSGEATNLVLEDGGYVVVGSYVDDEDFEHAIQWLYDDGSGIWSFEVLDNLPGYNNSRASSLMNVDWMGLVATGSSDNGPDAERATQWIIDDLGNVEVRDLNDVAFGADGWVLEVATDVNSFFDVFVEIGLSAVTGYGMRTGFGDDPHAFVLLEPRLDLYEPDPGIAGQNNVIRVERASPFETIHYIRGFVSGFAGVPGCPGVRINIANPSIAGTVVADADGVAELTAFVPPFARGRRVLLQAVEHANCDVSNLVDYTFR